MSRHVISNESNFPFKASHAQVPPISLPPMETATSLVLLIPSNSAHSHPQHACPTNTITPSAASLPVAHPSPTTGIDSSSAPDAHSPSSSDGSPISDSIAPAIPPQPIHQMETRTQTGTCKPNPKYALNATIIEQPIEPSCFSQAMKIFEWRRAMCSKFNALQKAGTWSLVPSTSTMHVLPNKWVYKIK